MAQRADAGGNLPCPRGGSGRTTRDAAVARPAAVASTWVPSAWAADASFECNRRSAVFSGWLIWWVAVMITRGDVLGGDGPLLDTAWHFLPSGLLALLATTGLAVA